MQKKNKVYVKTEDQKSSGNIFSSQNQLQVEFPVI